MPASHARSNKAKIARRVIEVLDYFDEDHKHATVLDIVRRYDRPQSSTSELLATLVELGLLRKDPIARTYSLTPRAALIGTAGMDGITTDGRLTGLIDRLVAQTGLTAAVFTLSGITAQIAYWRPGKRPSMASWQDQSCGMQEALHASAAGWLLLSTFSEQRCDGVLRRLNAEAVESEKFAMAEIVAQVSRARSENAIHGPAGFGSNARMATVLLPTELSDAPLAVGLVFKSLDPATPQLLIDCIRDAVRMDLQSDQAAKPAINLLQSAA